MAFFTKYFCVFILFFSCIACYSQTTIYVDSSMATSGNGSSWGNAYKYLNEALLYSQNKGIVDSILVAKGTYKPDANRDSSFKIQSGVIMMGGYASGGGNRDVLAYPTILSGDIGTIGDSSDNNYHVLFANGTDSTTTIDGCIITEGNGSNNFSTNDNGAGIYIKGGSITMNNCTFAKNITDYSGGAIYLEDASISLDNCTFYKNRANLYGGAICVESHTKSTSTKISNCLFKKNFTYIQGGAISVTNNKGNYGGSIKNCNFTENATNNIHCLKQDSGSFSLNIDQCNFEKDTNSTGTIFLSNVNKFTDFNFDISNSFFSNMIFGFYIQTITSTAIIEFENCIFDSVNGTIIHENTSGELYEKYKNCTFKNFGGIDNMSQSKYGILGKVYFNYDNCKFTSLPDSASQIRIGSFYDSIKTESVFTNCLFNNTYISSNSDNMGIVLNTFNNCTFYADKPMRCMESYFGKKTQNNHTFNNCIIWQSEKEPFVDLNTKQPHDNIILNNCIVKGDTAAEHIITNNTYYSSNYPQFVDTVNFPYNLHLSSCSNNAINRGDSNLIPFGVVTDLDSSARIKQNQVDLGAYESDYINNLDKIFISRDTICKNDTLSLYANYYNGSLHWQQNTGNSWSDIGTGNNPYNGIAVNSSSRFRAYLSTGCYDTSNIVSVTLLPHAVAGTLSINKDTIYSGDYIILNINNYSGFMRWQIDTGTGWISTIFANIKTLQVGPLHASAKFRAYVTVPCDDDSSNIVSVTVLKISGIQDFSKQNPEWSGQVFPVPFAEKLQVQFEGKAQIKITDMQGRIIYTGIGNNGSTIGTEGFAAGIYILTLENEKGEIQIKINKY